MTCIEDSRVPSKSQTLPQALVDKFFGSSLNLSIKQELLLYTRRTLFVYLAKRYLLLVNNLDKDKTVCVHTLASLIFAFGRFRFLNLLKLERET